MTASTGPLARQATRPARPGRGRAPWGGDGARAPVPGTRPVDACSPPGRPRSATVASTPVTGRYPLAVETPSDCSTLATTPVWGSKNDLLTDVQPPRWSMVNSVFGWGNLNLAATDGSTGR